MQNIQLTSLLLALCCSIAPVVCVAEPTADDYVTCTLVYSALFQAAKDTQHMPTLKYVGPRLKAVLPWIKANEGSPHTKELLRETATALEQEVKIVFLQNVKAAIARGDVNLLRSSFVRVFACDKALGIASFPLPLAVAPAWNRFADGFYSGCIAKQRRTSPQIPMGRVESYCRCMTNAMAAKQIDAESSDATMSDTIRSAHQTCSAAINLSSLPAR